MQHGKFQGTDSARVSRQRCWASKQRGYFVCSDDPAPQLPRGEGSATHVREVPFFGNLTHRKAAWSSHHRHGMGIFSVSIREGDVLEYARAVNRALSKLETKN